MILEAVRNHYVKLFGEPSRVAHFKNPGLSVEILKWDADRHPEGVAFYATVGRSGRPLPGLEPTHRIELFTGLLPAVDAVAFPLADVAACSNALQPGSTFTWSEPFRSSRALRPSNPSLPSRMCVRYRAGCAGTARPLEILHGAILES